MRSEIVVVVTLVVVVAAIIVPAIFRSQTQQRQMIGIDRLRHIGQHVRIYHETYRALPTYASPKGSRNAQQEQTQQGGEK